MPRVIFTHAVSDRDLWASRHSDRVAAFASWGSNVVDYLDSEGGNQVCVSVEVHDMEGMKTTMASPEIEAAKKAHGVLEPIVMFMENG